MHWDAIPDDVLEEVLPEPFDVLGVGLGIGSFIGRTVHKDMWRIIPDFNFRYACPSPSQEKAKRFRLVERMPEADVHHDFEEIAKRALEQTDVSRLIVWITVGTGNHLEMIRRAINAGVRIIVCDKPVVLRWTQYLEIEALLEQTGARIYITLNHKRCAAIEQQKRLAEKALADGKPIEIFDHFWQSWLNNDTDSKQA